jgi:hypothetical protein
MGSEFAALLQLGSLCEWLPISWFFVGALSGGFLLVGAVLAPLSGYERTEMFIEWCYYQRGYKKFVDVYNGPGASADDRGFRSLLKLLEQYGRFDKLEGDKDDIRYIGIGHPANDVFLIVYSESAPNNPKRSKTESIPELEATKNRVRRVAQPKIDTTVTWIGRIGRILAFLGAVLGFIYFVQSGLAEPVNVLGCRIIPVLLGR